MLINAELVHVETMICVKKIEEDACSIIFIRLRPIHSQVLTLFQSLPHASRLHRHLALGPLTYARPPKQVAVRPSTSRPQAARYFMLFHEVFDATRTLREPRVVFVKL